MNTSLTRSNKIFTIFFILMYGWGVLSTQHFSVGKFDFLLHLYVTLLVTLGGIGWYWGSKVKYTAISVYGWLAFSLVLIMQPLLHQYDYADSLIFPLGIVVMASMISLIAINMQESQKPIVISWLARGILIVGLLTVALQIMQLYGVALPPEIMMPLSEDGRPYANIAQINQVAFILVLAIVSLFYLYYNRLQTSNFLDTSRVLTDASTGGFNENVLFSKEKLNNRHPKDLMPLARGIALILGVLLLSIGLGFTGSRAGLILVGFALLTSLLYTSTKVSHKLFLTGLVLILVTVGFQISHWLIIHGVSASPMVSAVSRLSESNGLRKSLLLEGWLAFSQHPLTGLGWGNFSRFGMTQVDNLPWLENANHAHNIVAQITAEFGLLGIGCLGVLAWLMLRPLSRLLTGKLHNYQVYSYLMLATILLYSLSEYPLWYGRFLFLCAFFVGIIDHPLVIKKTDVRGFALIGLGIYLLALPYYIIQYYAYVGIQDKLTPELGYQRQMALYNLLPKVYGYSKFQDRMLFDIMLTDGNMGEQKTALGDRVMANYSYREYIEKQATLLAFAGKDKQARQLYHVLCKHEYTMTRNGLCPITISNIIESQAPTVNKANLTAQETNEWAKKYLINYSK